MVLDFICKDHGYQLCDSWENQICIKCFLVLRASTSKTEILLDMIDITFSSGSDFVGVIPFLRSTKCTRISAKVFFVININHSSTKRSGAWIITMSDFGAFSGVRVLFHLIFGHTNL